MFRNLFRSTRTPFLQTPFSITKLIHKSSLYTPLSSSFAEEKTQKQNGAKSTGVIVTSYSEFLTLLE